MNPRLTKKAPAWQFAARIATGFILLGLISTANAQTIKLATIAPEGSSWMNSMRAGAAEINERTEGRVKFKFYGGGVQGNDKQVLRKMRIGQLHGGAFTSNGLIDVQKDSQLYALPMLFSNYEGGRLCQFWICRWWVCPNHVKSAHSQP